MIKPDHKVRVVHEWLTEWGGSEDVLRALLEAFPGASLSATINYLSPANRVRLNTAEIQTSFLQRMPFVEKCFPAYLPLTPLAVESMNVGDADLIISSSHACAKGVLATSQQLLISYVHSPMRYAWDMHHQYLADYKLDRGLKGLAARYLFHRMRAWDRQTANNVDLFLANSRHVQQRIWRTYRRPSRVLYPPVNTERFSLQSDKEDFYVTVSRLVSYKRVDLMVDAFREMPNRKLVVIGDGPAAGELKRRCPANVNMLGWQADDVVARYLGSARAFIFAAHEDFGISPLEAQACGTPVIAFGVGGSKETVRDLRSQQWPTGILFEQQNSRSLIQAIEDFENSASKFSPHICQEWARNFGEQRFKNEVKAVVARAWEHWHADPQNLEELMFGGESEVEPSFNPGRST